MEIILKCFAVLVGVAMVIDAVTGYKKCYDFSMYLMNSILLICGILVIFVPILSEVLK